MRVFWGQDKEGGGVRSGPGEARTILLFHIISAGPPKQPRMVRTFLKVHTPAYYQCRVWNVAKTSDSKDLKGYKGNLIIEKATGRSVSPPPWESEGEEEDEEVGEEVREVTEAMVAVRVE